GAGDPAAADRGAAALARTPGSHRGHVRGNGSAAGADARRRPCSGLDPSAARYRARCRREAMSMAGATRTSGFTLLEMSVSVTVIGLLAAIASTAYSGMADM